MGKKDEKEMFKMFKKQNGNSLTQMDFFVEMDEKPDTPPTKRADNMVTPSTYAKKRKQDSIDNIENPSDDGGACFTKETVLVTSVDYAKKSKLTTIVGYHYGTLSTFFDTFWWILRFYFTVYSRAFFVSKGSFHG